MRTPRPTCVGPVATSAWFPPPAKGGGDNAAFAVRAADESDKVRPPGLSALPLGERVRVVECGVRSTRLPHSVSPERTPSMISRLHPALAVAAALMLTAPAARGQDPI